MREDHHKTVATATITTPTIKPTGSETTGVFMCWLMAFSPLRSASSARSGPGSPRQRSAAAAQCEGRKDKDGKRERDRKAVGNAGLCFERAAEREGSAADEREEGCDRSEPVEQPPS